MFLLNVTISYYILKYKSFFRAPRVRIMNHRMDNNVYGHRVGQRVSLDIVYKTNTLFEKRPFQLYKYLIQYS